jgi:hypothetical protein
MRHNVWRKVGWHIFALPERAYVPKRACPVLVHELMGFDEDGEHVRAAGNRQNRWVGAFGRPGGGYDVINGWPGQKRGKNDE